MLSISGCIETFIGDRVDEINDEVIAQDGEYKRLTKEAAQLYREILLRLPDGSKHLIAQYEEATGKKAIIGQAIIYRQGLKDGRQMTADKANSYRQRTDSIPTRRYKTNKK